MSTGMSPAIAHPAASACGSRAKPMASLLAALLALSACAPLPSDIPPRPALLKPATATTLAGLADAPGEAGPRAPAGAWWEAFGVPDLNQLIEAALHDAPDLAAAEARLRKAEQAERLARAETQVQSSTDASIVRQHLSKNGLFPPPIGGSTFTQTDLTESVSYTLDWWGRNRALVHAAGNDTRAAADEALAVRLAVAAAVADAYFAQADVEERLAVARALERDHQKVHGLLKARFELGLDPVQPLIDVRERLALDQDLIHGLEYLDHSLRYRMSALIGSDPDHAAVLPRPRLDAHLPPLPGRLPLDWLAARPDVAALRSRVEAAADLSAAARADFYPNLDLRGMLGLETLDLGKLFQANSLTASFGPALHLPFFNGRTLAARLGMQEADYADAVAAYNRTILDAARQAADASALIASLDGRSAAQQRALQEAERTRSLATQRRQLGLATPLDALEADSAVLGQRLNDIAIQAARLRARVALFHALGGATTEKESAP